MENNNSQPNETFIAKSLNTILLGVTLAVLGFIGTISYANSIALSKMEGAIMTRSEVEAKLAEVRTSQVGLEKELVLLRLEIMRVQNSLNNNKP